MSDQLINKHQEALDFANGIIETIREPLLILDNDLRVIRANRAFYHTFRADPAATEAQRIYDLGNGQWDIPALRTLLEASISHNTAFHDFEVAHTFPTIGHRVMRLNARKVYQPGHRAEAILLAIEDVTIQRQAELERQSLLAQAQRAQALAEEATRIRDHFLAIAGHELRNPLTTLLGNLQILQRRVAPALEDRDQRSLKSAIDQAFRIHRLITTLLDLAGSTDTVGGDPAEPVDLCELAQRLVERTEPLLEHHTIACQCGVAPAIVVGDALRLEQALTNLINNAIKYSPLGGHVQVTVERAAEGVCVQVSDTGLGIPEAAQQHLFDLFYRVEHGENIAIEGMGIGLYIVQQVVQQHHGSIRVVSAPDEGSQFIMCFPPAPPPSA
ncbi:PAS domain-containing protein [Chloroflexia bacterium SDU3-3]|nr:PAS domain-containing protein [Chloroflexia bacterium SDU3-3]